MEFLRQLANGVAQAWQRLSLSARVNLAIAAAVSVTVIAAVVILAGRAEYVRLYSGLSPDDSAAIQSTLQEEGVPYRVQRDGAVILVPVQHRSRMRVALMEEQLPRTHGVTPGFEIFDRQELLANRYLQDVNYMRAIQGELQRQLNEFEFVTRSAVFISQAREELFVAEREPSQAAVTINITRPVTPREVRALIGVISSYGGADLHPQNITLTTTDGRLLHEPARDEFASLASSQLEFLSELEQHRENKARRALEQLGVNAIVRVSADVDFSRTRETESIAEEGTPISNMLSTTSLLTTQTLPEGPPGAIANLPDDAFMQGGTQTEETTEEIIENFQPSTRVTETVTEPGVVTGYRVSAFVEGSYQDTIGEDGQPTGQQEYVALTDEQIEQYQEFIAAAVGVGVEAGDITVFDHPFQVDEVADAHAAMAMMEAAEFREMLLTYGINAGAVVLIIVGLFVVRRMMRNMTLPTPREEAPAEAAGPGGTAEDQRRRAVMTDVERVSQEDPEAVASLLRTWMTETED